MTAIYILGITLCILLLCWVTVFSTRHFLKIMKNQSFSIRPLFYDFRQKMWMTIGLGLVFFGLYVVVILFGSYKMDPELRRKIFLLVYQNPTFFIYFGLFTFASISLTIYLARVFIKYLYNSKSK